MSFLALRSPHRVPAGAGRLILTVEGSAVKRSDVRRLRQFIGRQKETVPVIAEMRRAGRY